MYEVVENDCYVIILYFFSLKKKTTAVPKI